MRRLILFRHAKSDRAAGVEDHARPLAERGRKDSADMGSYMASEGLRPDLALVSTARRTQETWNLARPAFAAEIARQDDGRIYKSSAEGLLDVIRETEPKVESLVVVGHNPEFHDLAVKLIKSAPEPVLARLREKLPTAGLVVIDFDIGPWSDIAMASGRLERFETPKTLG